MSDAMKPLRHEEGNAIERALLASGVEHETPPEGARGRALAALGLASPAAADLPPKSSPAASSAVLAKSWGVLAAVVVAGSAAVAGSSWQSLEAPAADAPAPATSASPVATDAGGGASPRVVPERATSSSPAAGATPAEPPTISPHALPDVSQRKSSTSNVRRSAGTAARAEAPPRAPVADDALARETALIDDTRRAVTAGDGARALALLEVHDREFSAGAFQLDAGVLRIEALERAGRSAEAERLARDFLSRHPAGSYARRARAALERIEGAKHGPTDRPQ